jgi:hypothetical protein
MIYGNWDTAMQPLWELQRRAREMQQATIAGAGSVVDRVGATATLALSDAASDQAPYLTGSLSSAHRGEWEDDHGLVYVDPGVINPIMGGKPSIYGVEVHGRKPWLDWTIEQDAPEIMDRAMQDLMAGWDDIWT